MMQFVWGGWSLQSHCDVRLGAQRGINHPAEAPVIFQCENFRSSTQPEYKCHSGMCTQSEYKCRSRYTVSALANPY